MRVSSRTDYGVRALFDLARHFGQGPIQSKDIASRQRIPEAYLHQVLGALNRAGLVRSTRGPQGGHQLSREPERVSLLDIFQALEGADRRKYVSTASGLPSHDVIGSIWNELHQRTNDMLSAITLAALLERQGTADDYVI